MLFQKEITNIIVFYHVSNDHDPPELATHVFHFNMMFPNKRNKYEHVGMMMVFLYRHYLYCLSTDQL